VAEREISIWSVYLDRHKSREEGRKISLKEALEAPTLAEIEKAAERLGLEPKVEKEKAYPREWWGTSGRVLVKKTKPKSLLLKELAAEIRRMRGSG
jgi:signal recognition particle subunit SRP19